MIFAEAMRKTWRECDLMTIRFFDVPSFQEEGSMASIKESVLTLDCMALFSSEEQEILLPHVLPRSTLA